MLHEFFINTCANTTLDSSTHIIPRKEMINGRPYYYFKAAELAESGEFVRAKGRRVRGRVLETGADEED